MRCDAMRCDAMRCDAMRCDAPLQCAVLWCGLQVATCGDDRTVRIWNYLTHSLELCKTFAERPCSIALHPSGWHVVIGFADRLKVCNVLMDELRLVKELAIKDCREVRFSNGGHLFAAAQAGTVLLFHTYTCELAAAPFKLHSARIRSLYFSLDDALLISAGYGAGAGAGSE